MSISSLIKSTIINGANSLSVAVKEGIIYRLQPVEEMQPIIFESFEKDRAKIFVLSDVLDQDYKIAGITVDVPEDDTESDTELATNGRADTVNAYIRIVKRNKEAENIYLSITSYPMYVNPLYIDHNDVWKVKLDRNVNRITFRCVPAIINTPKKIG